MIRYYYKSAGILPLWRYFPGPAPACTCLTRDRDDPKCRYHFHAIEFIRWATGSTVSLRRDAA
jgi:hypothetical protein